jgi:arylformamidase
MSRAVDLSVLVGTSTASPPAAQGAPVAIEHHRRGPGHWQVSSMSALLHTGSHVDSTWHVFADGEPISATPLDKVIGEASLIDCSDAGVREPLDADRLAAGGAAVRDGDILVIRTDWTDRAWGDFPAFYVDSPYLTEDAADWIVERSPKAVVFDFFEEYAAALPDFTSEDFVVHRRLLGEGLPLVEQATNLGALGRDRFTLFAPFFRLDGAEAAPCRIFALLD